MEGEGAERILGWKARYLSLPKIKELLGVLEISHIDKGSYQFRAIGYRKYLLLNTQSSPQLATILDLCLRSQSSDV